MRKAAQLALVAMATLLVGTLITEARAAPRTRFVEAKLPGWKIVRGRQQCSLYNEKGQKFAVELSGSDGRPTFFLMQYLPFKQRGNQALKFVLLPSKQAYDDHALAAEAGYIATADPEFLDSFSGSTGFSVQAGEKTLNYAFENAAAAVEALRACHDKLLRSWGVNPAALRALASPPVKKNPRSWFEEFDNLDVPGNVAGGDTILRIVVNADGSPRHCMTVASSGSAFQDAQSCAAIMSKGQFEPARNRAGQPVAATIAEVIRWASL